MCWKHKKLDLWEKAWKSFVYTMCQTKTCFGERKRLRNKLSHVIMFMVRAQSCCAPPWEWTKWCKTVFATCFLPQSCCAVPQVSGKELWALGPDSNWDLVHINSFKCHYKIWGAFYWLSWGSEVCLVHWVGVTLFLFFIKVWVRREHELTQVWVTRDTNSARHRRCSDKPFPESHGKGGNASNCFYCRGRNCVISPCFSWSPQKLLSLKIAFHK